MKLPLSSLAWRSRNKIVRHIHSRCARVLKETRWMQINTPSRFSSILLINELDCMKKGSEIFWYSSRKKNNWWQVAMTFSWGTSSGSHNHIDKYRQATSENDWCCGLASIQLSVNNKTSNNILSRLVKCQHLIARSWTSTSILKPGKHHNIQKILSYNDVFINLTASILELAHLFFSFSFLESQRERFSNQGMKHK
jgi:hypothetical protein